MSGHDSWEGAMTDWVTGDNFSFINIELNEAVERDWTENIEINQWRIINDQYFNMFVKVSAVYPITFTAITTGCMDNNIVYNNI